MVDTKSLHLRVPIWSTLPLPKKNITSSHLFGFPWLWPALQAFLDFEPVLLPVERYKAEPTRHPPADAAKGFRVEASNPRFSPWARARTKEKVSCRTPFRVGGCLQPVERITNTMMRDYKARVAAGLLNLSHSTCTLDLVQPDPDHAMASGTPLSFSVGFP